MFLGVKWVVSTTIVVLMAAVSESGGADVANTVFLGVFSFEEKSDFWLLWG